MTATSTLFVAAMLLSAPPSVTQVRVDPPKLTLAGPNAVHSLLVEGTTAEGRIVDLTSIATFTVGSESVARMRRNAVRASGDGDTTVRIEVLGQTLTVPVHVEGSTQPVEHHFANDIIPLLGRFGCNSSGCHGKSDGQNGFKLSVFGSDPEGDYAALLKEGRGRRIVPAAPERSLVLTKASGQAPHGGGSRMPVQSDAYKRLREWIAAGTPFGKPGTSMPAAIRIEPVERVMTFGSTQQLRVIAKFTDGREIDVTAESRFQTNADAVAGVSPDGEVRAAEVPGEVTIMAAYASEVAVFRALVPRPDAPPFTDRPAFNFIDPCVDAKLRMLNITPSGLCDDAEFLRRVSLDIIGTLPTPAEARAFFADASKDKRAKLVDRLLERPEYADRWALVWADVLRVERGTLGHRKAFAFHRWIRDSFVANKPFDQFARELVTAEGPLDEVGPANFFRVVAKPGEAASTISQVFMGVRIACAECHHHPFDRWTQDDYYGMQGFFAPVAVRKFGEVEAIVSQGDPVTTNPRTKLAVPPTPLNGKPLALVGDRRPELAKWLTAPENPWFAQHVANRYWAHFLGRGIVDPVDDVRATNPPSNRALLDALAKHLTDAKFDLKSLIRVIANSRTYQAASEPNATNLRDESNASRAIFKRIDAEVLLDAVSQATGVPEKFQGVPAGSRAIELWDSKVNHYFLKQFGRPVRASACECERSHEPNVAQVLHLLNAPEVNAKIAHEAGNVAKLVRTIGSDAALVEELYLTFYTRFPTADEKAVGVEYLTARKDRRRQAAEDIAWAMLNSTEFVFNH